jgi:K+-sensing histidine kinase KdpD
MADLPPGSTTSTAPESELPQPHPLKPAFLSQLPDLTLVLDAAGTVRCQAPPLDDAGGFDPHDLVGDHPTQYIHPADRERVCAQLQRLFESDPGTVVTTTFRLQATDGAYHRFEARAINHLHSEPVDGVLVVARPLQERTATAPESMTPEPMIDQLQETTQRLLETSEPDAAAIVALQGIESVFNFTIAGIWLASDDRTRLEPVAQTDRGANLVDSQPVYTADADSLSWDAYESQTATRIDDMTDHTERANPETPIRSELIVPIGEYGVLNIASTETGAFSDADLRRVQVWSNTVESALTRLEQIDRLQQREAALTRERDRLDDFASIISHDLRNMVNIAEGHLGVARSEEDLPQLDPVARALDRMDDIMDDTLTLARQGETVDDTEPVRLTNLVTDCLKVIEAPEATFTVADECRILADPDRLAHVFENLFRNSVEHGSTSSRSQADDAIDHGGSAVTVTIGRTEDGIYIADDGPGIPPDDRDTVFESGYTTSTDGTGLGLQIVKQIVEAHGWSITVTESEAGGARFDISGVLFIET